MSGRARPRFRRGCRRVTDHERVPYVRAWRGWAAFNSEQLGNRQDPVTWLGYLGEADFWNRSLQNWQSEMLAVGSMAVLGIYLRQRGSPESKPVGAAHADTGETG